MPPENLGEMPLLTENLGPSWTRHCRRCGRLDLSERWIRRGMPRLKAFGNANGSAPGVVATCSSLWMLQNRRVPRQTIEVSRLALRDRLDHGMGARLTY